MSIVKTPLEGGFVWIEHDDSVTLEDRIYTLHSQAGPAHSFSMGAAVARDVGHCLVDLTRSSKGDDVVRYVLTVRDGKHLWCNTCAANRPVWQAETASRELITCCAHCQRVLQRKTMAAPLQGD